jgi:nucleoside-diphosphate-sugar epimerase
MVNSLGTYQLLELTRRRGARFLVASTSEAYGDPLEHPQRETYWGNVNPVGVRSCYDEGKRFGEALTMAFIRQHQVDARIVRIFNTYGPRLDPNDGRMLCNFIAQALAGTPITVYGDGSKTRSLCYVSDLVDGLWRAASRPDTRGEIFNLGNPDERTVQEFAQIIRDLCGSASEITHLAEAPDDPSRRRPDITKAREMLGWEPHIPLQDGLREMIAWYRERLPSSAPLAS